jgi:hypothetical protein
MDTRCPASLDQSVTAVTACRYPLRVIDGFSIVPAGSLVDFSYSPISWFSCFIVSSNILAQLAVGRFALPGTLTSLHISIWEMRILY